MELGFDKAKIPTFRRNLDRIERAGGAFVAVYGKKRFDADNWRDQRKKGRCYYGKEEYGE